eukprot:TRINITY_DN1406_c0_g1_i1.p2 TRINITY_DN1406_c0_g1~~TRINITY_DN1406_c0_g1_i1.p2  ORF type:complete len:153 (+),score=49.47 TRINITY_DN1406_c0_g1_i1:35-460(+)
MADLDKNKAVLFVLFAVAALLLLSYRPKSHDHENGEDVVEVDAPDGVDEDDDSDDEDVEDDKDEPTDKNKKDMKKKGKEGKKAHKKDKKVSLMRKRGERDKGSEARMKVYIFFRGLKSEQKAEKGKEGKGEERKQGGQEEG